MLPSIRTIPVGGLSIALAILMLNLPIERPGAADASLARLAAPKRGALVVLAGLPDNREAVGSDEITGSIGENPDALLPLEIGETSSTELPLAAPAEEPPVTRVPPRSRSPYESRRID